MNAQFWLHLVGLVLIGAGAAMKNVPALAPFADPLTGLGLALAGGTALPAIAASNAAAQK